VFVPHVGFLSAGETKQRVEKSRGKADDVESVAKAIHGVSFKGEGLMFVRVVMFFDLPSQSLQPLAFFLHRRERSFEPCIPSLEVVGCLVHLVVKDDEPRVGCLASCNGVVPFLGR
jgi:hypothetical protein